MSHLLKEGHEVSSGAPRLSFAYAVKSEDQIVLRLDSFDDKFALNFAIPIMKMNRNIISQQVCSACCDRAGQGLLVRNDNRTVPTDESPSVH